MMYAIKKPLVVVCGMLLVFVFVACNKSDSSSSTNTSSLAVYLTDGPYDFQKVLVEIKSIQVLVDTCHRFGEEDDDDDNEANDDDHHGNNDDRDTSRGNCSSWNTLNFTPGVYDILTLRNGVDTLLGTSNLPAGKIIKLKMVLGTNNSILADNILKPLKLKDNVDFVVVHIRNEHLENISISNFKVILDFDLAKSIKYENGVYWLRPQLHPFCKKNSGEISGKIKPVNGYGMVKAYNNSDTVYALPDREKEGAFKIRGLKEGNYMVQITGANGFKDSLISNVVLKKDKEVKLGTIVLHQ